MAIETVASTVGASEAGVVVESAPVPGRRFEAVDVLRGAVMVLMVIDHTRDFFGDPNLNPTDLSRVGPAMFLTRWVTHFCAPVFAFLAGAGAYLTGTRYRSRGGLATFLASRGLWLIFLELTAVRLGMFFNPTARVFPLLVFWSIGGSLIALSGLVWLPSRVVGALGVLVIATHNLLDPVLPAPDATGWLAVLRVLFRPGGLPLPGGSSLMIPYSLIPWLGVVAAGYGFGGVIRLEPVRRRRAMWAIGLGLTAAFVVLRAVGGYGEPLAWTTQRTPVLTALSFLNCSKYPPSLLFLLMTLGPAIAAMAAIDRAGVRGPAGRALVTLGRVPLFYYLLQWYVIHGLAVVASLVRGFPVGWLFFADFPPVPPDGWVMGLPGVYAVWALVLALLYLPCRWFAGVKARHPGGWLSYL